jgi:hypothetical protein
MAQDMVSILNFLTSPLRLAFEDVMTRRYSGADGRPHLLLHEVQAVYAWAAKWCVGGSETV